jgi:hypothetical protein
MSLRRSFRLLSVFFVVGLPACDDARPGLVDPDAVERVLIVGAGGPELHLAPGESFRVTAQVYDVSGRVSARYAVDWGSNNSAAVAVDSTGVVTGVTPGRGAVIATVRGTTMSGSLPVIVAQ